MGAGKRSANHYLWFDTEYTTLDLDRARLLQVALVVTDVHLRRVHPPEEDVNLYLRYEETPDRWVEDNLADLLVRCKDPSAIDVETADRRLAELLDGIFGRPNPEVRLRPVLAGNSIHADWYLVRRFLPGLVERVHYRLLDVTTVKLEWMRWFRGAPFDKEDPEQVRAYFPGANLDGEIGPHDAYYDVQASIAELAYYRSGLRRVEQQEPAAGEEAESR